jgi:predicted glycoside hydrolase/deacetylase ChbG (UPF0249 family)
VTSVSALATRLGHHADARLVIFTADDLGMTRSANIGVFDALRNGLVSAAGLMVPCPWARDAAAGYRGDDVGVHLTLNAEVPIYRWGPTTRSPSLSDGDGGFPRTLEDLWDHADLDEVRRESRVQIERAIAWGFDPSHLSSHLSALVQRPEFFDVFVELAVDFGLPVRLPGADAERRIGFPVRKLAAEEGLVFPDWVVAPKGASRRTFERVLFDLQPGVTELRLHPAVASEELRAACEDWAERVDDHGLTRHDRAFADLVERTGAVVIGWRALRDAQRIG